MRGRATVGQQPEAWITSDRGIVLPGGTGRAVAIIRHLDGTVPLANELSLRWRQPQGLIHSETIITCPSDGMGHLELDEMALAGGWHAEVWWRPNRSEEFIRLQQHRIEVGSFVPDRIEADLNLPQQQADNLGIPVALQAHWLTRKRLASKPKPRATSNNAASLRATVIILISCEVAKPSIAIDVINSASSANNSTKQARP